MSQGFTSQSGLWHIHPLSSNYGHCHPIMVQEARDLMDRKHFREAIKHLREQATPCASKAFEEAMCLTVEAMCWTKLQNVDKAAEVN